MAKAATNNPGVDMGDVDFGEDDELPVGRNAPAGVVPESSRRAGLGDAAQSRSNRGSAQGAAHARASKAAIDAGEVPPGRSAVRPVTRGNTRPQAMTVGRDGHVMVEGRSGEMLSRRRARVEDVFYVPPEEIPAGWSYQWNSVTVTGSEVVEVQVQMHQNGWRPVPAERHEGRWFPPGTKGAIVVKGLRLEERPVQLTREALDEDKTRAKMQVRDQTDSLRLTQKALPGSQVARNRNVAGGMRMEIDPALDIPQPGNYQDPDD